MATSRPNAGLGDFQALFQVGSFVGMSDAELLERYITGCGGIAEVAFAALVERHGPMVLRVCNEVLNDPHDAQDAAQVTFLVLAKRAGAIRRRNALASWLFGVARRVAARARVEAARRRAHERRRAEMAAREHDRRSRTAVTGEPWAELFEEIDRLSERHRSAIVLCDLEGLTHEQAARRLGCPVKTVQGRLYRARELLRHRLTRRGVTTTAGMLGVTLAQRTASAAPSAAWVAGDGPSRGPTRGGPGSGAVSLGRVRRAVSTGVEGHDDDQVEDRGAGGIGPRRRLRWGWRWPGAGWTIPRSWTGRRRGRMAAARSPPLAAQPLDPAAAGAGGRPDAEGEQPEAGRPGDAQLPGGPRAFPGARDPGAGRQAAPELARRHTALSG